MTDARAFAISGITLEAWWARRGELRAWLQSLQRWERSLYACLLAEPALRAWIDRKKKPSALSAAERHVPLRAMRAAIRAALGPRPYDDIDNSGVEAIWDERAAYDAGNAVARMRGAVYDIDDIATAAHVAANADPYAASGRLIEIIDRRFQREWSTNRTISVPKARAGSARALRAPAVSLLALPTYREAVLRAGHALNPDALATSLVAWADALGDTGAVMSDLIAERGSVEAALPDLRALATAPSE
jgi:hypothetical protein